MLILGSALEIHKVASEGMKRVLPYAEDFWSA